MQSQPARQPLRPSEPQSELKSARHCCGNTELRPRQAADCRQLPHSKQNLSSSAEIRPENPSNRRQTSPTLPRHSLEPSIQTPHGRQNLAHPTPPESEPQDPAGISTNSSLEARFGALRAAGRPAAMARRCGTPASREETLGGVGGWGSEEGASSGASAAAARNLLPLVLVGGWRTGGCLPWWSAVDFGLAR